jgi:chromosome segregation ATPase
MCKALEKNAIICPNCRKRSRSIVKLFVSKISHNPSKSLFKKIHKTENNFAKEDTIMDENAIVQSNQNHEELIENLHQQIIILNDEVKRVIGELEFAFENSEEDNREIQNLKNRIAVLNHQTNLLKEENKNQIQQLDLQVHMIRERERKLQEELIQLNRTSNKEQLLNISLHNQMNQMRNELVKSQEEISSSHLINLELQNELDKVKNIRITSE